MNDKPFPCPKKGCNVSFANEDHLNMHKKKHEMALNLALISKTETCSDQTPTPTRFIRNCEEVGLFQDLQHVNPFEETFKKAIELTKNGQIHIPQASTDDTLHTPHILPHIIQEKLNASQNLSDTEDSDFNINTLQMKNSDEAFQSEQSTAAIKELPSKMKPPIKVILQKKPETKGKKLKPYLNIYDKNIPDLVKRREMNRVAQMRCRMKKKELNYNIEHKMITLKKQNEMLMLENSQLKSEVTRLNLLMNGQKNVDIKVSVPKRPIMPKINAVGTLRPILLQAAPLQFVNVTNLSRDINKSSEREVLIRPEDIKVEVEN